MTIPYFFIFLVDGGRNQTPPPAACFLPQSHSFCSVVAVEVPIIGVFKLSFVCLLYFTRDLVYNQSRTHWPFSRRTGPGVLLTIVQLQCWVEFYVFGILRRDGVFYL